MNRTRFRLIAWEPTFVSSIYSVLGSSGLPASAGWYIISLIRRLSTIYGGRASGYGLLKLTGRVISHLAVTGGVALADSFVSQIVGTGLAARLSAKLGEGVLNGVLTARVGIAAASLCRPLPFIEMRGIPFFRYQNEDVALAEAELRWNFTPRWALVAFAGRGKSDETASAWGVGIRRLVEPILPDLPVISLGELPPQMPVQSLSMWELHRVA